MGNNPEPSIAIWRCEHFLDQNYEILDTGHQKNIYTNKKEQEQKQEHKNIYTYFTKHMGCDSRLVFSDWVFCEDMPTGIFVVGLLKWKHRRTEHKKNWWRAKSGPRPGFGPPPASHRRAHPPPAGKHRDSKETVIRQQILKTRGKYVCLIVLISQRTIKRTTLDVAENIGLSFGYLWGMVWNRIPAIDNPWFRSYR